MSATRMTGLYSMIAAAGAVLFAPLLALAYFATGEGADELQAGTVSAWAGPALELAGGPLTWGSPDRVYATYLQVFALLFPAIVLCARAMRAQRPASSGRLERWGWRISLAGYGLVTVGLLAAAAVLVGGSVESDALNVAFLSLLLPGLLVSVLGSTVLGIALVRNHYAPKLTAWLLALAFPLLLVGSVVLGHNSLGLVPLFVAWAASGRQLWRVEPRAHSVDLATAGEPHAPR